MTGSAAASDGAVVGAVVGAVDGAVYGLLGLLMAFTFSGAATRFEDRRQLIRAEANAIGTAWLRADLLEEKSRKINERERDLEREREELARLNQERVAALERVSGLSAEDLKELEKKEKEKKKP